MKKIALSIISIFTFVSAWAQLNFVGNTDKDALSYKCGENINFTIQLYDGDKIKEGVPLKWIITSDDGAPARSGTTVSGKEPLKLTTKCDKPGFVRVRVFHLDENGKQKKGKKWNKKAFQGGAGVEVEKICTSTEEPADFDEFWSRQLKELAKVPEKCVIVKNEKLSKKFKNHNVFELTVDCLGKPAKAWLSIPKNADKKSLPINISLHGYGVGRELPYILDNAICLRVARHSCELMSDGKYYANLKKGELKGFGLSAKINKNPENCYFKFMLLRDYKTLAWVKKNVPEWNGKDITVRGGSMGGFRSIFLSYLDKDITECRPNVPWMTDLWAFDNNTTRQKCEFRPQWTPSIRYFDATFAIKRVKCPVYITAWLGDYTCPPAGIMALYNNSKTKTTIDFGQNGIHNGANEFSKNCKHYTLKK